MIEANLAIRVNFELFDYSVLIGIGVNLGALRVAIYIPYAWKHFWRWEWTRECDRWRLRCPCVLMSWADYPR